MNLSEQLKLKIALEERFRPEVRRLFSRIRIEFRIGVATGTRIRADRYYPQWISLLQTQYRRVQGGFNGVVQDNTKQVKVTNDEVLAALIAWADLNAPLSAARITETTQKNMDEAIAQARQAFADDGTTAYTDRDLALAAAAILGRKLRGREQSIIMTETQSAAESTKLIEAYSLAGLAPMAVVTRERVTPTNDRKEWMTMGDDLVRAAHDNANGQSVNLQEPFIVAGQQLMYPGDNSRGATVGNTINCRCASFYVFTGVN